jgi:hypothetical protein
MLATARCAREDKELAFEAAEPAKIAKRRRV